MIRSTRRLRHGLAIPPILLVGLPSQAALIDLGNVTRDTVHNIGQTGVTYISSGARPPSVAAMDCCLNIVVCPTVTQR